MISVRIAGSEDHDLFDGVDDDVFDGPVEARFLTEFLADPRHHIAVAMDGSVMVGMCSGLHYVHPDKPAAMWINELGVATRLRRRGLATGLIGAILDHARILGCVEAWVVADPTEEAVSFYRSLKAEQTGTNLAMFNFDLTP